MKAFLSYEMAKIIRECFSADQELIDTFHIETGDLNQSVKRTTDDLAGAHPSFKFYEIRNEDRIVGFFGKEHSNYLTTIFIHPDHRNKSSVSLIWKLINEHFDCDFYTAIYKKNTRAAKFFERNGELIEEFTNGKDESLAFKFRK